MDLPNISYHPHKHAPETKPQPHTPPKKHGMADALFGMEKEKSPVALFWERFHELDEGPASAAADDVKSAIATAAKAKGYLVKGDLDRTARVFAEMEECPWAKETCPCARFQEFGDCKKKMIVPGPTGAGPGTV